MRLFLVVLLSLTLLSGCSWTRDLMIKTKPVDRIPLVLPEADEYFSRPIEWVIVTPETQKAVFDQLRNKGRPVAIIGLSGDQYELLSLNVGDQLQFIKQLNATINAYKKYYIAVEKRDAEIKVVE